MEITDGFATQPIIAGKVVETAARTKPKRGTTDSDNAIAKETAERLLPRMRAG